ncbi:SMP-30/gluconolactonase/LRE family protein [Ramlibacter tataouinensis]|uniref:Gluconolactonase-like protein n=1 Tax=Ramlibacter tataouinensis (strain ATCC BAA-407 / DSM 14655 / LMG 21543 / TTB310) TaxID=365046 RepID=F5XVV0_RAMTT|nr:SMP-30/gluconolactonase/LRE family protein [Ramlibacter tataouinensis]AEG92863.1 gluconolactonase precursor-like protein [Ramlibacter tataouinensis TTB310]
MPTLVDAIEPRFAVLAGQAAAPECLHEGGLWLEGPLWLPDSQQLLFSDIPRDVVLRWVPGLGVGVFSRGGFQNGRTRDGQGRIVFCEHGGRRLMARGLDGLQAVLASHHAGGRLNSPNDVVARPDGSLWFTDPDYGILSDYEGHRAPSEQAACHVFRLAPGAAEPQPVVAAMVKPNGLAFSPEGRWLYVADSGGSHIPGTPPEIRRFAVGPGGEIEAAGVLARLDCGLPDGMAVDEEGNVWSSAGDGVHCFAPDGRLLGRLRLGCVSSNLCFGGPQGRRLFITTAQRLLAVDVGVRGAPELR